VRRICAFSDLQCQDPKRRATFVPPTEVLTATISVHLRYRIKIFDSLQCHNVNIVT
jgi:hypothetical protein